jgi:hypothetical protein
MTSLPHSTTWRCLQRVGLCPGRIIWMPHCLARGLPGMKTGTAISSLRILRQASSPWQGREEPLGDDTWALPRGRGRGEEGEREGRKCANRD